jgi:lipoprotein-releasing system permease protein
MIGRAERFIGWRYLVSKRSVRFINVIGVVSVAGITVGVAALLVALSVFNGFNSVVTKVLVTFDPHLRIEVPGAMDSAAYAGASAAVAGDRRVSAWSPFVSGKALLSAGYRQRVVFVRGVEERSLEAVTGVGSRMVLGGTGLAAVDGVPGIIVGITLADRLSSVVGSEITVVSPAGMQGAVAGTGAPVQHRYRIAGIFESQNREYDANYAFISIDEAARLFDLPGKVSGLDVRIRDIEDAAAVKASLVAALPAGFDVSTWYDLHRSLYTVMQVERWSAYVLLSLIVAVATFNVLGSLTMSVLEKRRDIAVLRTCGLARGSVVKIFLFEGLVTGAAGTAAGLVLGLGVILLQKEFGLFPLDPTVYIIPAIPVEIRLGDFLSVTAASMGLSTLAAFYPARRASMVEPAAALRWE